MKLDQLRLGSSLFLLLVILSSSCQAAKKVEPPAVKEEVAVSSSSPSIDNQIGQYIVELFEDSQGNIWIGTLAKGVAKYDGVTLRYYTTEDGLVGNGVVDIVEDQEGYLWMGTQSGLSRFDGESFTNYTEQDGLPHFRVSNLLIDSKGNFWVGTWRGVCRFKDGSFTSLPLPKPAVDVVPNEFTKDWITEIMEDEQGNIWFGRDGYGACRYDGDSFTHFTKKDGLASNNVQAIEEDAQGNIWFGTRVAEKDKPDPDQRFGAGGAQRFDGTAFTNFTEQKGLSDNDVYMIYSDEASNLWISTINQGLYQFDGQLFTHYPVHGLDPDDSKAIQSILEDGNGHFWIGCSGGLFRLNSQGLEEVTKDALGTALQFTTVYKS